MARCHCRCRKCEGRRVLRRHPNRYLRPPACHNCGARSWRPDKWMNQRDTRQLACFGGCYWFWHRKGSLHCLYRVDGTERRPGDPDYHPWGGPPPPNPDPLPLEQLSAAALEFDDECLCPF